MAEKPVLLLVDDDVIFCSVLARALEKRGYDVHTVHTATDALPAAKATLPAYAIIDLKMPGDSGLTAIPPLKAINPDMKILMLTGYASIATAVEAIKLGATYYLTKPTDADAILAALHKETGDSAMPISDQPMSPERLEWEHLQKVLSDCGGNISEAARLLNMHRRTLQRKLAKRPVKN